MTKIIRCEEVTTPPILITLGDDIQVDIARVSAYNSIRLLEIITSVSGDPEHDAEIVASATAIVMDILREQNIDMTDEQLLRAGNQAQLNAFVSTLVAQTLKTYQPLERSDNPFVVALRQSLISNR